MPQNNIEPLECVQSLESEQDYVVAEFIPDVRPHPSQAHMVEESSPLIGM